MWPAAAYPGTPVVPQLLARGGPYQVAVDNKSIYSSVAATHAARAMRLHATT